MKSEILDKDEVPYTTGLIQDPPDNRDIVYTARGVNGYTPDIEDMPQVVDYSSEMSPIKNQGNLGCHDEETKVLTDEGGKYFFNLSGEENVATVNPNNFEIEFQRPINYFEYLYEGYMYHLQNQANDFKVTPNHRMWVRKGNQPTKSLDDKFSFIEMENLGWYSGLPTEFEGTGNNDDYFYPEPAIIGPYNGDKYSLRKMSPISMEDGARFLGLYLAEGYTNKPSKGNYRVGISSSVNKPQHREKIKEILSKVPIKWTEYNDRYVCNSKVLYENLKEFGKVYDKFIPDYIKNAKEDIILAFIEGYALGDGYIDSKENINIGTSSEDMKDDLQEIGLKIGKFPSVYWENNGRTKYSTIEERKIYASCVNYQVVFHRNQKKKSIDKKKYVNKVPYNGYVYCVEVPNQTLITKRNEKILVSGNSCVGFAVAAVREWQQKKEYLAEKKQGSKYERETPEYDLSESWIYGNCKKIDEFPNSEGTTIRAAMKVLKKIGVPSEKAWPYTDDTSNPGKPKVWSKMTARWGKIKGYHKITDIESLLEYVNNHGPVVAGILLFRGFYDPGSDGFVPLPDAGEEPVGAHAVPICGFIKDKGENKLIIKNSGGSNWGDGGFGLLKWKYGWKYSLNTGAPTNMNVKRADIEGMWEGMKK